MIADDGFVDGFKDKVRALRTLKDCLSLQSATFLILMYWVCCLSIVMIAGDGWLKESGDQLGIIAAPWLLQTLLCFVKLLLWEMLLQQSL